MSLEMWVVPGVLFLLGATMLARPETFAFWSIHRRPEVLAASRAVGGLLVAAPIVAAIAGCAESTPSSTPPSEPTERSAAAAPASAPTTSATKPGQEVYGATAAPIEILAVGTSPHRRLAYRPRATDRTVALSWAMRMGGADPQMRFNLRLAWRSASDSTRSYRFSISQASIQGPSPAPGAESAAFEAIERGYEGVAGTVTVARDHLAFEQTQGMRTTPAVAMLLQLLTVPLPSQAVGVGARWRSTEAVGKPGAKGTAARSFHLLALDDVGARIEVTRSSTVPSKGAAQPTHAADFEGVIEVSFDDILPRSAKGTLRESLAVPGAPGGDGQAEEATVEIELAASDETK